MGATPMEIGTSACDTGVSRQMSARDSFRRHAPRQGKLYLLVFPLAGALWGCLFVPLVLCMLQWLHTTFRLSSYWGHRNIKEDVTPSTSAHAYWALVLVLLMGALLWGLWAVVALLGKGGPSRTLTRLTWAASFLCMCNAFLLGFGVVDMVLLAPLYLWLPHPFWLASLLRVLCDYPVMLGLLAVQCVVLEGLFMALEYITTPQPQPQEQQQEHAQCPRRWRGHWFQRWLELSLCVQCGFCLTLFWTCFEIWAIGVWGMQPPKLVGQGQWWQYPFPFPMDLVGVVGGLLVSATVFCVRRLKDRGVEHDPMGWLRRRCFDMKRYCQRQAGKGSCGTEAAWLLQQWIELRQGLRMGFKLGQITRLAFNHFCPSLIRRRCMGRTRFRMSLRRGYQVSIEDELEWNRIGFIVSSLLKVIPLVLGWFYQRYLNPQQANLVPQYGTLPIEARDGVGAEWAWSGVLPPSVNVIVEAHYDTIWPQALGGVGGRCLGLTPAVDVLPDRRYYFNVQLLLYVVFFLYCFWFFQRESKEKLAVSVATRLGGIYNAGQRNHRYQWLDRVLLLGLGGVYTLSVLKNSVTQGYLLVGTPADWRQESGPFGYWYAVCETVPPGIMLAVRYVLLASDSIGISVLQGLIFFYSCYELAEAQAEVYDFVDRDRFFTLHLEDPDPASTCSYWSLSALRDSGKVVGHKDVMRWLHTQIYGPFLLEVRRTWPCLLHDFLNEADYQWLQRELDHIETERREGAESEEGTGEEKDPGDTSEPPPFLGDIEY